MNEIQVIVKLSELIDRMFYGYGKDITDLADVPVSQMPELNVLAEKIFTLSKQYSDARNFIIELARGHLYTDPPRNNTFANPFKQLHSELNHLAWQITQIADGDYDQKVSFFGDFSDAMNRMIAALRERQELAEKIVESQRQLREYAEELKRTNATKDKLFSIIAHDLRNPFHAFIGLSEVLISDLENGNNSMALEYARMMNESAENGYQLLVNLLDWSRQQRNTIVYTPRLFNLEDMINRTISIISTSAASKNITIEFIVDEKWTLNSDEAIFSTVFRNLLSNAVKYTPDGGCITVEVVKSAEFYNISVKDSGVGIPAGKLKTLFSGDAVASTPGTNHEKGTGLGLMLCRDFVRMLGGDIWVESVEGKGSTFTFSVPNKD